MRTRAVALVTMLCAMAAPMAGTLPGTVPPALAGPGTVGGSGLDTSGIAVSEASGAPEPPEVSASSYLVADLDSGAVLAAKDPHGRYRPASTIKALTALALIPELEPDEKVEPERSDAAVEGSKVGVVPGHTYRVGDLFQGLLLASGNDAALTLARAAGGLEETLTRMNATARELRALDTVAKTPHGLDRPGQRSSAYDLALIGRAGLRMPRFREYVTTERAKFPAPKGDDFQISNHNDLLMEYEGCIGVKTGYTTRAGATYIGAAKRDGRRVIVTMMHSEPGLWEDARALLDWGFAAHGEVDPVGRLVEPRAPATASPSESPSSKASPGPVARDGAAGVTGEQGGGRLLPGVLVGVLAAVAVTGSAILLFGRSLRTPHRGRRRNPPR